MSKLPSSLLLDEVWNISKPETLPILNRLRSHPTTLGEECRIFQGLVTGADKAFISEKRIAQEKTIKPFLEPDSLVPYSRPRSNLWMLFPYHIEQGKANLIETTFFKKQYPRSWDHLVSFRKVLEGRERGKWRHDRWYAFGRSQNLTQMDDPKLIIQVTANRPTVLYDDIGIYMTGGGSGPFYGIRPKESSSYTLQSLLGILNSSLFGWVIKNQSTNLRGGYIKFSKQYIETFPLPERLGKSQHDLMVSLVERMLDLQGRREKASGHEKTLIERQIAATDKEIDRLVYELYELSPEEIRIVEEAVAR